MLSSRAILRAGRARVPVPKGITAPKAVANQQYRSYATPSAADSKPPIALFGLDGTYATALVRFSFSSAAGR